MRRAILAVCGTLAGTTLLVAAKSGYPPADIGAALEPAAGPAGSGRPSPGSPGGAASPSSTRAGAKPAATTSHPAGTRTTAPAGGGSGGGLHDGTFPGSSATYLYGTVKVTITVSAGRITGVTATYPTSAQSGVINGKAIPQLHQETLAAQNADIATVSGATLTSGAYRTSLQAAIDRAQG